MGDYCFDTQAERSAPASRGDLCERCAPEHPVIPPCSPLCHSIHQFAESLGNAMDAKDHCTQDHSEQVAVIAHCLALEVGFSPRRAGDIHIAGHLHDIGKIGLPDCILSKPGRLTEEEWAAVRRHPEIGAQIVAPVKALNGDSGIAAMILHHHERWDGGGYPHGLRARKIPPGARVLAVADALSAMVQDRPYRSGMSIELALDELRSAAGSQLDPDMVAAFLPLAERAFKRQWPRNANEAVALLSRMHAPSPDAVELEEATAR
ncbi:HD family phosphohydrolase [Oceanidesulfovibrio indonesiensis]|uniref:HD family phosphohydrolase n=1 Tax=Oceanidesulfovibrio indonesiensis TaxID=54767 RepID=A0A7M3MHZ1_9BACT|nr:HD-GYP domain-containing protein [Oceanidesulfovibrio indonesiensis]TVM19308.1 HD family phosphohydrolase [Oceanidesulfovibrio indonesiensis]